MCWVMMERQCDAAVQRKLADYVRDGDRLIMIGRICLEEFDHTPCTILQAALGIAAVHGGRPFVASQIQALGYQDIPASFVETYDGKFGEIIAADANGKAVGFIQPIGRGQALMLDAALTANAGGSRRAEPDSMERSCYAGKQQAPSSGARRLPDGCRPPAGATAWQSGQGDLPPLGGAGMVDGGKDRSGGAAHPPALGQGGWRCWSAGWSGGREDDLAQLI